MGPTLVVNLLPHIELQRLRLFSYAPFFSHAYIAMAFFLVMAVYGAAATWVRPPRAIVCVCVCARQGVQRKRAITCVRACMRACACVRARVRACVRVRVCVRVQGERASECCAHECTLPHGELAPVIVVWAAVLCGL